MGSPPSSRPVQPSLLDRHGREKNLLERHRSDVDRSRTKRTSLVDDGTGPRARQNGEHSSLAPHPHDAGGLEEGYGRVAVENQADAATVLPKIFERACEHRAAAVDD